MTATTHEERARALGALVGKSSYGAIDTDFAIYFEKLGYGVTYEGRRATGERWHEIYNDEGRVCQVAFGTPLAEFLTDLPYIVEGKSGVGPTDYWCACEDDNKLRELLGRVRAVDATAHERL